MLQSPFKLASKFKPKGDQPQAIKKLTQGLIKGVPCQTLLGVTGSGKTFTMANIIRNVGKPTLIISHNKTLAAQLYAEFKGFFPKNAVHYFVSYYDYYQPEAYLPARDIYIEKDASINENLDRLRLATTSALLSRQDVIIVASVSCIYGLGSPVDYAEMILTLKKEEPMKRESIIKRLVELQYKRNEMVLKRGCFRSRGDVVEVIPGYEDKAIRIVLNDERIHQIVRFDPLTGEELLELETLTIFPAKHFVMPEDKIIRAMRTIKEELKGRLAELRGTGSLVEAQKLEARTKYDLEMLREIGYCKGIENYSRHLSDRLPGQRPYTLIDYFPKDFLMFVDESHATVPQVRGMYQGDRSRKEILVEYGFRLPSALDNRPMRFDEWEKTLNQVIFVSATPGPYEMEKTDGRVIEQIIRPTGLIDPFITIKSTQGQIKDLIREILIRIRRKERVLVTTLTKRLAEDLNYYLQDKSIKGKYLHSEIKTIERTKILRELREGKFDVLVGVNLLREGLDLPEVSLVAIMDADKEGFLRSETSLIQTVGRTARNVNGAVFLYADVMTGSMERAIKETERRRKIQLAFNKKYRITPRTIQKEILKGIEEMEAVEEVVVAAAYQRRGEYETNELVQELNKKMQEAAERLEFERAAEIRDAIQKLKANKK
ncbi:excinuclease ABC subunit UvrB [Planctomycetota bacterium]